MYSRPFRVFKNSMGQANHFLITTLIGLDAVEDGAKKRDDFPAKWEPRDVSSSVSRSKLYIMNAAMAWTVDNLDMYLRLCNTKPALYGMEEGQEIGGTGHSVYQKFKTVSDRHSEAFPEGMIAYIDLLICWRNRLIHFDADNKLIPSSARYFDEVKKNSINDICVEKYHLDVAQMLERFENKNSPSFKEIATLISMTIHFVEKLDETLLKEVQQRSYLEDLLYVMLKEDKKHHPSVLNPRNTTPEKRKKKLKQLFATKGVTEEFYNDDGELFLEEVVQLTEEEFLKRIQEERDKKETKLEEDE